MRFIKLSNWGFSNRQFKIYQTIKLRFIKLWNWGLSNYQIEVYQAFLLRFIKLSNWSSLLSDWEGITHSKSKTYVLHAVWSPMALHRSSNEVFARVDHHKLSAQGNNSKTLSHYKEECIWMINRSLVQKRPKFQFSKALYLQAYIHLLASTPCTRTSRSAKRSGFLWV